MFCPKCGIELNNSDNICSNCGNVLANAQPQNIINGTTKIVKKAPVLCIVLFIIGIILIFVNGSIGAGLYNGFKTYDLDYEHPIGFGYPYIDHHCDSYGESHDYVNILGLKLWHEESCQNFILILGFLLVIISIIIYIKQHNTVHTQQASENSNVYVYAKRSDGVYFCKNCWNEQTELNDGHCLKCGYEFEKHLKL